MTSRGAKRKKETIVEVEDFYRIGKELQNRSGTNIGAIHNEDRRFREFFGCGARVALAVWTLLIQYDYLPDDGMILHMLWALFFMKVYPKQEGGSSAAGGSSGVIDPKTWRKYIWPFIEAIAYLEQFVVSYFCMLILTYITISYVVVLYQTHPLYLSLII